MTYITKRDEWVQLKNKISHIVGCNKNGISTYSIMSKLNISSMSEERRIRAILASLRKSGKVILINSIPRLWKSTRKERRTELKEGPPIFRHGRERVAGITMTSSHAMMKRSWRDELYQLSAEPDRALPIINSIENSLATGGVFRNESFKIGMTSMPTSSKLR